MTAGEAIIAAVGLAIIAGVLVRACSPGSILWAVVAGAAVVAVFYLIIIGAASKERKKFANQLPEVLTLLVYFAAGWVLDHASDRSRCGRGAGTIEPRVRPGHV